MSTAWSAGSTKILPSPISPFGAGAGHAGERFDRAVEKVVVDHDFQGDLAQQVRLVLVAAVDLGLAALPAVALGVADRHPRDADLGQAPRATASELGRLNDGDDQFHAIAGARDVADAAQRRLR